MAATLIALLFAASVGSVRAPPKAFAAQAGGERAAQADLPQSRAPMWAALRRTRISQDTGRGFFAAAFPPEVKGMAGKTVTLSGFMMPLDSQAKSRHFLLSKYTPVCFFCPPGEPNEVVEVFSRQGVPISYSLLNVTGRFDLTNQTDQGLFFRISDAAVR